MDTDTSFVPGYRTLNPATGQLLETFTTATDEEVDMTLQRATASFASWRITELQDRATIVAKIGDLLMDRAGDLAKTATIEMGKRLSEGKNEVEFSADIFKYFATEGPSLATPEEIKTPSGGKAYIQKLPVGPLLGIMPWNFPFYQVARFVAPNLMLGNTIILKHAESCPRSALAISRVLYDAGVPEGVYSNVFANHDQIARIIADERLQGVSLTGSERAGASIGAQAGRHLKKAVLELGGSDPYIILDTDNVEQAAETAWATRLDNGGQACNSNKRIIVHEDIYEDFVSALTKQAEALRPGDPMVDEPDIYGPLSSRAAGKILCEQVEDAVSKGAKLHVGGYLVDGPGAYFAPAVLTGVTPAMRAYYEELFGPVAVVYQVSDDDDALRLANDTAYGLGGAVFSTDEDRAINFATQLEVGMANVNTPGVEAPELPFGGVKRSGFGRELGPLGMDEFVNKRLFYIAN